MSLSITLLKIVLQISSLKTLPKVIAKRWTMFYGLELQTSCNTLQRHTKLKFHQRNYVIKGLRSAKRDHLKIMFRTFSEIVRMATFFIYIYKLSRILVDKDSHFYSFL